MIEVAGLEAWGGLAGVPPERATVVVAGIPYDGSAVYRKGAAQGPSAIRRLSTVMPPVNEHGQPLADVGVHDLGDLDLGTSVEQGWRQVAERLAAVPPASFLTVVGGDHCAAVPVLAAQARRHPDLAVLWVDAHPDLCDYSRGGRWTCGCALRRALEAADLGSDSLLLAACRDFDLEEVAYVGLEGVAMVTAANLAAGFEAALARLLESVKGRPLHVSFDIDALDPAFAPGTEIAAAGGLSTRQALDLLAAAARRTRLVGLDVCEVAPPLDHADITTLAALKLIFETWSLVT
jgi:agmatinase